MRYKNISLQSNKQGENIRVLHLFLQRIGYVIDKNELNKKTFGKSTEEAIKDFQRKNGLPANGIVDIITAPKLIAATNKKGGLDWEVKGKVKHEDGTFLEEISVRAFDKDFRSEELLGETVTKEDGFYTIKFKQEKFTREEKFSPDLFIRVFSESGDLLAESGVTMNAGLVETINLTVKAKEVITREFTEYERVLRSINEVTRGAAITSITNEELKFIAGETGEDSELIKSMMRAFELSEISELSSEILYVFTDKISDLKALANQKRQSLEPQIETAVKAKKISSQNKGNIDAFFKGLQQWADSSIIHTYLFEGKLINKETKSPLSGYRIEVFTQLTKKVEDLVSSSQSNEDGEFTVSFVAKAKRGFNPSEERDLTLGIMNSSGHFIRTVVVKSKLSNLGLEVIELDVLEIPTSVTIQQVIEDLDIQINEKGKNAPKKFKKLKDRFNRKGKSSLLKLLGRHDINQLDDVRRVAKFNLLSLAGEKKEHFKEAFKQLETAARFQMIAPENRIKKAIIDKGYSSYMQIAQTPASKFVADISGEVGEYQANSIYQKAAKTDLIVGNLMASYVGDRANGLIPNQQPVVDLDPTVDHCSCEDCEAAVSPSAYLADLFRYASNNIFDGQHPIPYSFLEGMFNQPFTNLPFSCGAVTQQVRQVRIAVEVLLHYIKSNVFGPSAFSLEETEAIQSTISAYAQKAYRLILIKTGTSYSEIRLSKRFNTEEQNALSERLGIPVKYLARLNVDITQIVEKDLEDRFGLKSFYKSDGVFSDRFEDTITNSELLKWRAENLRQIWYLQDFRPDPFSDSLLFSTDLNAATDLNASNVSDELKTIFSEEGYPISGNPKVSVIAADLSWHVKDPSQFFIIRKIEGRIKVFREREYPIIDPDLVGPDDFRIPTEGQVVFDLWLKRRRWIDEIIINLTQVDNFRDLVSRMKNEVGTRYTLTPWPNDVSINGLEGWTRKLKKGEEVITLQRELTNKLKLDTNAFNRMMELGNKGETDFSQNLTQEEKQELINICILSIKEKITADWIFEEREQVIMLGHKEFWAAISEPVEGNWSPLSIASPLINPELVGRESLPDPVFGSKIITLWDTRNEYLKGKEEEFRQFVVDSDIDQLFISIFINSDPPAIGNIDRMTTHFDTLNQGLPEGNPILLQAIDYIQNTLFLSVEDFRIIMEVRQKENTVGIQPSEEEWDKFLRIMAKLSWKYIPVNNVENWEAIEESLNLTYWKAFKQKLPKWRSNRGTRRLWQRALHNNGEIPIVEPDLFLNTGKDFKTLLTENRAFQLFEDRTTWINKILITDIPDSDERNRYDQQLSDRIGISLDDLIILDDQGKQGEIISNRLNQLNLRFSAFNALIRLGRLLEEGQTILLEEWEDAFAILLQVQKQRVFAEWREEERLLEISLSPDYFKIEEPELIFPLPSLPVLPRWRARFRDRRNWEEILEARIEQEKHLTLAVENMINEVEEIVLPSLKDELLNIHEWTEGISKESQIRWLSERLLIDFEMAGCQTTTRISQAIETLQNLLWSLRTGLFTDINPNLRIASNDFEEDWRWIGSYATWRAATFIFLYPQNVLHPSLKEYKSDQFEKLLEFVGTKQGITPIEAKEQAESFENYYTDISDLDVEVSCQVGDKAYWYAISKKSGNIYWSSISKDENISPDFAQSPWQPIPDETINNDNNYKVNKLIGAVLINNVDSSPERIYIFYLSKSKLPGTIGGKFLLLTHNFLDQEGSFKESIDIGLPPGADTSSSEENSMYYTSSSWDTLIAQSRKTAKLIPIFFKPHSSHVLSYFNLFNPYKNEWEYADFFTFFNSQTALISKNSFDFVIPFNVGSSNYFVSNPYYFFLSKINEDDYNQQGTSIGFIRVDSSGHSLSPSGLPTLLKLNGENISGEWLGAFLSPKLRAEDNDRVLAYARLGQSQYLLTIEHDGDWHLSEVSGFNKLSIDSGWGNGNIIIAQRQTKEIDIGEVYSSEDISTRDVHYNVARMIGSPFNTNHFGYQTHFIASPAAINPVDIRPNPKILFRFEHTRAVWNGNTNNSAIYTPLSTLAYLEEYYYFVPLLLAIELQRNGFYLEALDWFRTIYDYSEPNPLKRKIWYGLEREESPDEQFLERMVNWQKDALDPHKIAGTRPNSYTRYTLQALTQCILDYADSEFTRDTAESIPRARELYELALNVLNHGALNQRFNAPNPNSCENKIAELLIELREALAGDPINSSTGSLVNDLEDFLRGLINIGQLEHAAGIIQTFLKEWLDSKLSDVEIFNIFKDKFGESFPSELEKINPNPVLGDILTNADIVAGKFHDGFIALDSVYDNVQKSLFVSFPSHSGHELNSIETIVFGDPLPMISPQMDFRAESKNTLLPSQSQGASPAIIASFCVPLNPVLRMLNLRAESNLFKIRHCMNIAGIRRSLNPYAAPTDTTSGIPFIGADGQLVLPGISNIQPTIYRFRIIIERAKQLVQIAEQMESAMLRAIANHENEEYRQLELKQQIKLTKQKIKFENLKLSEAGQNVELEKLKKTRVSITASHFANLLDEDMLLEETLNLALQISVAALYYQASIAASMPGPSGAGNAASGYSYQASQNSTLANIASQKASFERLKKDWQYQFEIASQEILIADQQISISESRKRVINQEKVIAELEAQNAIQLADFLSEKFINSLLYSWMSNTLENIYRYFLQQATAMAKLAYNQLVFERQASPSAIIQDDYWEQPSLHKLSSLDNDGESSDRRGLTGSARLLRDIIKLDQYAFETQERKLQLSRTISLSQLDPYAFAQLRQTGRMTFRTNMELFDRDFPGHYLRLIKRVRISVVALVPPTEGIRATLRTTGLSRVVVGGDLFQTIILQRTPEEVALTSPRQATGVFEFEQQSELLYPFESIGVDTFWSFDMPKASNPIDYSTVADVLMTIEYTALNNYTYRQQVIQQLGDTFEASRVFSFRYQFADAWYDLHNPQQSDTPMQVTFKTRRADFPPNLEDLSTQHLELFIIKKRNENEQEEPAIQLPIELGFILSADLPLDNLNTNVTLYEASSPDGIYSTIRGNASSWFALSNIDPFGRWVLAFPDTEVIRNRFKSEEIEDIIFVISYRGRTPGWES